MKLDYTEFSFGYAFTENLILSYAKPRSAPYFPNLRQEAKLGYDVCIDFPGCPLFFQYKLPELMSRDTAKELSHPCLKGKLKAPFFRMHLMSNQHEQLIKLEKDWKDSVYYATPRMENICLFNDAYINEEVHKRSFLFSPVDIDQLPDNRKHSIAYCDKGAWVCSEPRKIKTFTFKDIEAKIVESLKESRRSSLESVANEIRKKILEPIPPHFKEYASQIEEQIIAKFSERPEIDSRTRRVVRNLLVARKIAFLAFGLEMVIAQPPRCRDALR